MNFRQLTAFREVMITGSVSAAARNLNRSQPSVSALIADLEAGLGMTLFKRAAGRLKPVSEAHFLLAEANQILARLQKARQALANIRDIDAGTVGMVSMPGPALFLLPELVSQFVEGRDEIRFSLISRSSLEAHELVSAQQFDLGLVDTTLGFALQSQLLEYEHFRFDCVCAMRTDDPLAAKSRITASDLDGKPMAALFDEHATTRQLRAAFDVANARFHRRFEMQYFMPTFSLVEKGLAYAVVDPVSAEGYRLNRGKHSALVFRRFAPAIKYTCAILTPLHRPQSVTGEAFRKQLHQELHRIERHNPPTAAAPAPLSAESKAPRTTPRTKSKSPARSNGASSASKSKQTARHRSPVR